MHRAKSALAIILISIAISAGCIKVNNPAENKGPATLSEVTTATSVSAEGQPLAVAGIFLATTPAIYVTAKVNNAPENTSVGVKWFYVNNESGQPVSRQLAEETKTARGTQYVSFSTQSVGGSWGAGQYSASLYLNGKEVAVTPFTVKAVQTTAAQAPTISYFRALPEAISTGQAVTLSWATTDAARVEISTIGSVPPTGNSIVTPVNSVEYQLTATNSAGNTSMKVNIRVTSFNSDKPDLVITDFRVQGDKAFYKIKNIGGVEAKESRTGIYINGLPQDQGRVEMLAPGQEREYSFPSLKWGYGTQRNYKIPVRVCADDYNSIGEYDDSNNCLVLDW